MILHKTHWLQFILGVIALGVGVVFYMYCRPSQDVYFIRFFQFHSAGEKACLYSFVNNLPTFIHTFAFSLMTVGLLACSKSCHFYVVAGWVGFDMGLEILQGKIHLLPNLSEKLFFLPFFDNTKNYIEFGVFDSLDMLSILLGGVAAYGILCVLNKRE